MEIKYMAVKRVLSVGQCYADHDSITRILTRHFAAEVVAAATVEEVEERLRQRTFDLILVNRIFDADGFSGLDLIERLKKDSASRDIPVMLVSNYVDAQQEAMARGALPGFGKASLGQPQMLDRLGSVLDGK
jgi:two-component system chemotaxis response regulator CheY